MEMPGGGYRKMIGVGLMAAALTAAACGGGGGEAPSADRDLHETTTTTTTIDTLDTTTTEITYVFDQEHLDGTEDIAEGMRGEEVASLQIAMGRLGCGDLEPDGVFGAHTKQVVRDMQLITGASNAAGVADTITQEKIVEGLDQGITDCWESVEIPAEVTECMADAAHNPADLGPIPADAPRFTAKVTVYAPEDDSVDPVVQGGMSDRQCEAGLQNHTLEAYLEGKQGLQGEGAYVALAMDTNAFPYGTVVRVPQFEEAYGQPIIMKIVDTGGAFVDKGTTRVDLMVRTAYADQHDRMGDREAIEFVVIRTPEQ